MKSACNPFPAASDFNKLYIFGAGGHARELAWLAEQIWGQQIELIFLVDKPEYRRGPVNGIEVRLLSEISPASDCRFTVAIGDARTRRRAAHLCKTAGLQPVTLIHPRAEISRWATVDEGAVICAGTIITANVSVGPYVNINIGCTVSHDVSIMDFSTLSPGVHVSGHVQIGSDTLIGTGANIINGSPDKPLVIGSSAIIAAGACVTRPVEAGALVAGVPAERKR